MFHFVANLKPYLWDPLPSRSRFDGYLLSPDYGREARAVLAELQGSTRWLAADNGNFDNIGKVIAALTSRATPLARARRAEQRRLGRPLRPGEIPVALRDRHRRLATEAAKAARSATPVRYVRAALRAQAAMAPAYLIGMEDFTIATMAGLGIEPEHVGLPLRWYSRRQERAVEYALATKAGAYGEVEALVFAGLHALDFDTAAQAGRLAGEAGVDGIACGLGSALGDPSFVDFAVRNGAVTLLSRSLPRSYLRVAAVASGMHLGHVEATGRRPRFHALGVGSPIFVPLLAALSDAGTFTATDSTAPIADAWTSKTTTVYGWRPAPLKLKAHKVVQVWLEGGRPWDCPCPFCTAFLASSPFRITAARAWWRSEGRRALTPSDLWGPSPLAEHMPLLAHPQDRALRREAAMARIWHNHWALRRLEQAAKRRARSRRRLLDWVEGVVARYERAASAEVWRVAVRTAWTMVRDVAEATAGAEPGGEVGD